MKFFDKIKKVITQPTNFFKAIKKEKGIGPAFIYYVVFLVISSVFMIPYLWRVLSQASAEVTSGQGIPFSLGTMIPSMVVMQFVFGIIMLFIVYGIVHLLVKLVKGKGDFSDTLKAMVYGATPNFLFSPLLLIYLGIVGITNMALVIPVYFVGFAVFIWCLVIQVKGIKILHNLSTWRAVLAIIILPIILILIIAIILLLILVAIAGTFLAALSAL
ncbi:YIP1 family protein [Candidatus Woesearchaeota archaeon]|nr:YIP1 family protein [Candidatus Woesearchaeota archaeon]